MISLKDFMEVTNYRITEGGDYCWKCYGSNAYQLDSWNGDNDNGYNISIVFDTSTQVVYQMEACDYKNQRAYRLINPDFKEAIALEVKERGGVAIVKVGSHEEAWDGVQFIDLELEGDFLEKTQAIVAGEEYDTRVQITVDLSDDTLFELMKMAHACDNTLNEFVCGVLATEIATLNPEVTE